MSPPNTRTERITRADLEPLATKVELAKKTDKVDLEQGLIGVLNVIERVQATLRDEIAASATTLRAEIAEHTRASAEHVIVTLRADIKQYTRAADGECQRRVAGVDDKYADLPDRVGELEAQQRR